MRPLTEREKRIVRIAGAGILIYLALFYGWQFVEKQRSAYRQLSRRRKISGGKPCLMPPRFRS